MLSFSMQAACSRSATCTGSETIAMKPCAMCDASRPAVCISLCLLNYTSNQDTVIKPADIVSDRLPHLGLFHLADISCCVLEANVHFLFNICAVMIKTFLDRKKNMNFKSRVSQI